MLTVKKFGGTSVGSIARIKRVAEKVAVNNTHAGETAVVLSAMSGETNRLLGLAKELAEMPDRRETDVLVSTGEQVTVALFTIALRKLGVAAVSFLGHQIQIETEGIHGQARIKKIETERINEALRSGQIPVIAGFQGVDVNGNVTTLGRGGSDTTAVAVASAIGAEVCEIYTDVDGIYTADPRIVPNAQKMDEIIYEEMLEFASYGAKMHPRSIELGAVYSMPILVASSFGNAAGTLIHGGTTVELRNKVRGIASDLDIARVTILGVADQPGIAAKIFDPLADNGISVDVIVQNASENNLTDLSFTIAEADLERALETVNSVGKQINARGIVSDSDLAKVTIVGTGMQNSPGYASRMFQCLYESKVNIEMITTSEIRITCIISKNEVAVAVAALHAAFELDS